MKNDHFEKLLLLEQTGELSARQHRELAELRRQSPGGAKKLEKELQWLAKELPMPPAPSTEALQNGIHQRLSRPEGMRRARFFRPMVWAAAAAAVLLLFPVLRLVPRVQPSVPVEMAQVDVEEDAWEDPYDAEFEEIEKLIASISVDEFINEIDL